MFFLLLLFCTAGKPHGRAPSNCLQEIRKLAKQETRCQVIMTRAKSAVTAWDPRIQDTLKIFSQEFLWASFTENVLDVARCSLGLWNRKEMCHTKERKNLGPSYHNTCRVWYCSFLSKTPWRYSYRSPKEPINDLLTWDSSWGHKIQEMSEIVEQETWRQVIKTLTKPAMVL